jgi:hypothetical protein
MSTKTFLKKVLLSTVMTDLSLFQMESAFVNFDLKLPRGASIGLYARRNALPTHTNYDLMEVIKGVEDKPRSARAVKVNTLLSTLYVH